jgi:hypothetical protein
VRRRTTEIKSSNTQLGDPLKHTTSLVGDDCCVAVPGMDNGVGRQGQQLVANRSKDRWFVRVAATCRSGTTTEQGVPRDNEPGAHVVETAAPRRVPRSMQHSKLMTSDLHRLTRYYLTVGRGVGVDDVPQHPIVGMQQDWCVDSFSQGHSSVDVVVVAMGEHDRPYSTAADRVDDRLVVVGGIEDHHLAVVADQPDVVLNLPLATIESEYSFGSDEFNRHSDYHYRAKNFARFHLVERFLNRVEGDGFRHETFEVQTALQVQIDQHREIAARETVSVPGRLE